jgi:small nuclear ribonucleoprotein D2
LPFPVSLRSDLKNKPKSELTEAEIRKIEEEEFSTGPLSLLTMAVKSGNQILVSCRNNRKLLGRVKAFDRHMNLVLGGIRLLELGDYGV